MDRPRQSPGGTGTGHQCSRTRRQSYQPASGIPDYQAVTPAIAGFAEIRTRCNTGLSRAFGGTLDCPESTLIPNRLKPVSVRASIELVPIRRKMRKAYLVSRVLYVAITVGLAYLLIRMASGDHPWWFFLGALVALSMGAVSSYFSYRAFLTGVADPKRSAVITPLVYAWLLWMVVFITWSLTSQRG